jgi:uncharacterized protein YceK
MRLLITAIATTLLAGCASVPATQTATAYDHKYNVSRSVAKAPASEFVGTSASTKRSATATPSWYAFGHP